MGALPPPVSDISIAANGITLPSFRLTVGLHLRKAARQGAKKPGASIKTRPAGFSKTSQPFAAAAAKESPIIFFGDMCGEENTSQAASVEFVRRRRTNYARSRLQPLCQKVLLFDSPTGRARQCGQICFLRQRGRTSQGRAARWHTSAAKHPCPCPCRA